MARVLYCTKCGHGIVVTGELPAECPHCHSTTWRSGNEPLKKYELTLQDRAFLETLRIDSSE